MGSIAAIPDPTPFHHWLKQNSNLLQPPVNNFCLHAGNDFILMVVGGPNARNDFHVNETEVRVFQVGSDLRRILTAPGMVLPDERQHAAPHSRERRVPRHPYSRGRHILTSRQHSTLADPIRRHCRDGDGAATTQRQRRSTAMVLLKRRTQAAYPDQRRGLPLHRSRHATKAFDRAMAAG